MGSDVELEWTAGWPRMRSFSVRIGALASVLAVAVATWIWHEEQVTSVVLLVGLPLVAALAYLDLDRMYRVTQNGLTFRRRLPGSPVRRVPWEAFDGFSVTDDAVVLHRPFPHPDVRCARSDVIENEPAIVETLEAYLERRT